MDVAALIVSVVAVFLSVIVAGFAMGLQWLMFRASTDQLTSIGKENAALVANVATSLGKIQQTTTITQDTVSRQLEQVTGRLLDGVLADQARSIPEDGTGDARGQPVERSEMEWQIERTISQARRHSAVGRMLTFLGGQDEGRSYEEIREHMGSTIKDDPYGIGSALDFFQALGSLGALDAIDIKNDKLALTETGERAFEGLAV